MQKTEKQKFADRQQAVVRLSREDGSTEERDCTIEEAIPEARCYRISVRNPDGSTENWRVHESELFHSRKEAYMNADADHA